MREAEADRDQTYKVNVLGALAVAQACSEIGARLVHIGSVAIFDGVKGFYSEADEPNPTYYYGETKLQSEEVVRETLDDYVIVRTDFFVPGLFKYKTVLTDHYCSKLPVGQLAVRVGAIVLSSFTGTINVGGKRDSLFNILKTSAPDIEGITIAESTMPNFPRDLSLDTSLFDSRLLTNVIRFVKL